MKIILEYNKKQQDGLISASLCNWHQFLNPFFIQKFIWIKKRNLWYVLVINEYNIYEFLHIVFFQPWLTIKSQRYCTISTQGALFGCVGSLTWLKQNELKYVRKKVELTGSLITLECLHSGS